MSADEALKILADQARYDLGPFLLFGDKKNPGIAVNIHAMKEAGLTHLIKSITPTKEGDRIDFVDKQYALNLIMKAHGAYKDVHEIRGIVTTTPLTDEQLERFVAGIIERARKRTTDESEK